MRQEDRNGRKSGMAAGQRDHRDTIPFPFLLLLSSCRFLTLLSPRFPFTKDTLQVNRPSHRLAWASAETDHSSYRRNR